KRELEDFVLHERLRLETKYGSNIHTSALNRTIAAIKSFGLMSNIYTQNELYFWKVNEKLDTELREFKNYIFQS
nr:hypothetical protein [Bifidobacterium bifidum]